MWVSPRSELRSTIQPAVLSMYEKKGDLWSRFVYTGTRDYVPFCVVPHALKFIESLGGLDAVQRYLHDLVKYAGGVCSKRWGTTTFVPLTCDELYGSLIDVRFPTDDWAVAQKVRETLDKQFDMYMIVHQLHGHVWTRLSAAIYLEEKDFDYLADKVMEVIDTFQNTN
jgi:selenocysteine lyase/cysteine desulfurase